MDQVFADPQVQHLGMAVPVPKSDGGNLTLVSPAIVLSRTPARMKRTIGAAGEHNDMILHELGYTEAEISGLRAADVI
jgi:formyl-CoA transferase